jgi:hypothetical protein
MHVYILNASSTKSTHEAESTSTIEQGIDNRHYSAPSRVVADADKLCNVTRMQKLIESSNSYKQVNSKGCMMRAHKATHPRRWVIE